MVHMVHTRMANKNHNRRIVYAPQKLWIRLAAKLILDPARKDKSISAWFREQAKQYTK